MVVAHIVITAKLNTKLNSNTGEFGRMERKTIGAMRIIRLRSGENLGKIALSISTIS